MQPTALWQLLAAIREQTLQSLEGVSDEQADVIPEEFNNHIRWHAGHILYTQDVLALKFAGLPIPFDGRWKTWFGNGSKPADWNDQPPALGEIVRYLREQPDRLCRALDGKLDDRLERPSRGLETVGECLFYSLVHEGEHRGIIRVYRKLLTR